MYRYLSVQYHCQHLTGTVKYDAAYVDVEAVIYDLTSLLSAFGMYMRDLGKLANGRSHIHPKSSDLAQLSKELYDTARRVHHTIEHLYCPPPFQKSTAWQEFCELVAQIAEKEPVFGKSRDYKLSPKDQIEKMITLALYTGCKVRSPRWFNRLLGRPTHTIQFQYANAVDANNQKAIKPTADYDGPLSMGDASVKRVYTGTPDQFIAAGVHPSLNKKSGRRKEGLHE